MPNLQAYDANGVPVAGVTKPDGMAYDASGAPTGSVAVQARASLASRGLTPGAVKAGQGLSSPDQFSFQQKPGHTFMDGLLSNPLEGLDSSLDAAQQFTAMGSRDPSGADVLSATGIPNLSATAKESYRRGEANESTADMYGQTAQSAALAAALNYAPQVGEGLSRAGTAIKGGLKAAYPEIPLIGKPANAFVKGAGEALGSRAAQKAIVPTPAAPVAPEAVHPAGTDFPMKPMSPPVSAGEPSVGSPPINPPDLVQNLIQNPPNPAKAMWESPTISDHPFTPANSIQGQVGTPQTPGLNPPDLVQRLMNPPRQPPNLPSKPVDISAPEMRPAAPNSRPFSGPKPHKVPEKILNAPVETNIEMPQVGKKTEFITSNDAIPGKELSAGDEETGVGTRTVAQVSKDGTKAEIHTKNPDGISTSHWIEVKQSHLPGTQPGSMSSHEAMMAQLSKAKEMIDAAKAKAAKGKP